MLSFYSKEYNLFHLNVWNHWKNTISTEGFSNEIVKSYFSFYLWAENKFPSAIQHLPEWLLKHRGSYFWGSPMYSSSLYFPCSFPIYLVQSAALPPSLNVFLWLKASWSQTFLTNLTTQESTVRGVTQPIIYRFWVIMILLSFWRKWFVI